MNQTIAQLILFIGTIALVAVVAFALGHRLGYTHGGDVTTAPISPLPDGTPEPPLVDSFSWEENARVMAVTDRILVLFYEGGNVIYSTHYNSFPPYQKGQTVYLEIITVSNGTKFRNAEPLKLAQYEILSVLHSVHRGFTMHRILETTRMEVAVQKVETETTEHPSTN